MDFYADFKMWWAGESAPKGREKREKSEAIALHFFLFAFLTHKRAQKTLARASFARPLTKFEHKSFDLSFFSYIDMIEIK